jgi:ribosomal silencing factor RsfS
MLQAEESLARAKKELATVLKEKKCRDCLVCCEGLAGQKGEALIKELNERLFAKSTQANHLEETNRK